MDELGLRRTPLRDSRASCRTCLADNGVPDHILARVGRARGCPDHEEVVVKPGVEDLREVATTWGGLHGPPIQVREKS
ncbi:hypothetical protein ACFYO2_14290 [Streptomyces sp. NPDC006602]|uniref:hypothetical protein n=1 Tax=Streptomyces sp. NPDC006602 TaxID=3364751 RepID=UPI00369A43D2